VFVLMRFLPSVEMTAFLADGVFTPSVTFCTKPVGWLSSNVGDGIANPVPLRSTVLPARGAPTEDSVVGATLAVAHSRSLRSGVEAQQALADPGWGFHDGAAGDLPG